MNKQEVDTLSLLQQAIKHLLPLIYYSHIHTVKGVRAAEFNSHEAELKDAQKFVWDNCIVVKGEHQLKLFNPSGAASKSKRDYRKFFTPASTASFMADLLSPGNGDFVLEPSAGNGALVKAVKEKNQKSIVCAVELNADFESELRKVSDVVVIKDFIDIPINPKFSSCISNHPFGNETKLQSHIDHIRLCVKLGGKIVMIVPKDFNPQIDHKTHSLENWSKNSDGTVTEIKIIEFFNGTEATQAGPVWVKAMIRLPEHHKSVPVKFTDTGVYSIGAVEGDAFYVTGYAKITKLEGIEWLDESGQQVFTRDQVLLAYYDGFNQSHYSHQHPDRFPKRECESAGKEYTATNYPETK